MTKFVRDLMHIGVVTCPIDTPVLNAIKTLKSKNLESLVVLDKYSRAVGVFGRPEVIAAYTRAGANPHHLKRLTVFDMMRPNIPEIPPSIPAVTAAQIMIDQSLREMFIMHHQDGGTPDRPVGVLSVDDVITYLADDGGE